MQGEQRVLVHHRFAPDVPAECLHHAAAEGQAHARPLVGQLGGEERVEDAALHAGRDAHGAVADGQHVAVAVWPGGNLDVALAGDPDGVERVLQEIEQHVHQQRIGADEAPVGAERLHPHVLALAVLERIAGEGHVHAGMQRVGGEGPPVQPLQRDRGQRHVDHAVRGGHLRGDRSGQPGQALQHGRMRRRRAQPVVDGEAVAVQQVGPRAGDLGGLQADRPSGVRTSCATVAASA